MVVLLLLLGDLVSLLRWWLLMALFHSLESPPSRFFFQRSTKTAQK